MSTYQILFLGDVVGKPGRDAVHELLPDLKKEFDPLFTIINGENAAGGVGITPDIADELFADGADAITLGNHAYNKREIYDYLDSGRAIVRPANQPAGCPGTGMVTVTKEGINLAVINLCGRVFLGGYGDPFAEIMRLIDEATTKHIFLDFHAEATSEKIAMGFHVDGKVTAVIGTHTHVTTADETILAGGTAYLTDVGMCGPENSVLGTDREIILRKFRTSMPERHEVAKEKGFISAVLIEVNRQTGRATAIERIRRNASR